MLSFGLLLGLLVVGVLWYDGYQTMRASERAQNNWAAVRNGQRVLWALQMYASKNASSYPDTHHPGLKSANEVFRELFKGGVLSDERIFNVPGSAFAADNNIGSAPAFEEALRPGECHWMLLKGQTGTEHGRTPILIESALNTSWPPRWDVTPIEGKRRKGQARVNRIVVIVRSDGSANTESLRPDGTLDWRSFSSIGPDGKNWIDTLTPEQVAKLEYWDVEEK